MSTNDTRLDRLLPGLTVKERAILMLRDFKAGKPQDRQLLNTAPDRQTTELNRLIGLMNAANGDLAHLVAIIHERAQKEELRFSWLEWARICALEMWAVRAQFIMTGREPITRSEYRKREREAREELMPVEACANDLAEAYDGWNDADCEIDEEGERSPTDAAWYRVRDQKMKELRELVAAGTLAGKGKGKRLKIHCGSLYDWLKEPVPVVPDLGTAYDVRPDKQAAEMARVRADHEFIRRLLDRGAFKLDLPLDMKSPLSMEPQRFGVDMARLLVVRIWSSLKEDWRELRAIEEQIESITEDFDGEDPLLERMREQVDEAKSILVELHGQVQKYTGPFELPDPDEELRAMVQTIVDNEVKHLPTR